MMFQSISYWKLLWKYRSIRTGIDTGEVSIHLLLEIALEDEDGVGGGVVDIRFNPSLIGNCSGSGHVLVLCILPYEVSIHLLLEIALEALADNIVAGILCGFNPSLIGNCSGSILQQQFNALK